MLLFYFRKSSPTKTIRIPQFFFIQHFPFTVSASRHADLILNSAEFRDRCMTLGRNKTGFTVAQGGKIDALPPITSLPTPGGRLLLVSGIPRFSILKHRRRLTLASCAMLILLLLRFPSAKSPDPAKILDLPFYDSLAMDLPVTGSRVGIRTPANVSHPFFLISFYIEAGPQPSAIQIGNATLNTSDLRWKGKHYLRLAPRNNEQMVWLTLKPVGKNPKEQHLEIRNIEFQTAYTPEQCRREEIAPLSDAEKLHLASICLLTVEQNDFYSIEQIRSLRQSLSKQIATLQFDYVRAKNLGNRNQTQQLLTAMVNTLADPFDPRVQKAKYLLVKKQE